MSQNASPSKAPMKVMIKVPAKAPLDRPSAPKAVPSPASPPTVAAAAAPSPNKMATPTMKSARKTPTPVGTPAAAAAGVPPKATPSKAAGQKRDRDDAEAAPAVPSSSSPLATSSSANTNHVPMVPMSGAVPITGVTFPKRHGRRPAKDEATLAAEAALLANRKAHLAPAFAQTNSDAYYAFEDEAVGDDDDDEYEIVTEKIYLRLPAFDHFMDLGYDRQVGLLGQRLRMADMETKDPKMYFVLGDDDEDKNSNDNTANADGPVAAAAASERLDHFYVDPITGQPVSCTQSTVPPSSNSNSNGSGSGVAPFVYRKMCAMNPSQSLTAAFVGRWEGAERRLTGLTNQVVCSLVKDSETALIGGAGGLKKTEGEDSTIPSVFRKSTYVKEEMERVTEKEKQRKKYGGANLHRQLTTGIKAAEETNGWCVEAVVPVKSSIVMSRLL